VITAAAKPTNFGRFSSSCFHLTYSLAIQQRLREAAAAGAQAASAAATVAAAAEQQQGVEAAAAGVT
jgi:hypothetical protein